MNIPKDPFEAELLRDKLAGENKLKELAATYRPGYPQIPDHNSAKLWDNLNDREYISQSESPMTWHKIRLIAESIPDSDKKVINIGCGGGDLENVVFGELKKLNLNWTGVDISAKSIAKCRKKFKKAKFEVADFRTKTYGNNMFDLVVMMEVLEHITPSETFKVLSKVKRLLKESGIFIISVPMNEGLKELIAKGENPNAHVRTYTARLLKAELKIAGFAVDREVQLYAFRNHFKLKSFIARYIFRNFAAPNNILIFTTKIQ